MRDNSAANILILIHSENGGTYELAKEIEAGVTSGGIVSAVIKQVKASDNPTLKSTPVASADELANYDGIAFGSPVYFGNISTGMSEFLAKTASFWSSHSLEGVPATVFMSAGSGAGRELATQAFWNCLSVHGMILVSNGIRGGEYLDNDIPQGTTVLGVTSLASLKSINRPSESERCLARIQGQNFANVVLALKGRTIQRLGSTSTSSVSIHGQDLGENGINLPPAPRPVGNYTPYAWSGNLVFINQIALRDGEVFHPGKLGESLNEAEAKEATRVTMLNVLAVLNDAVSGNLNRVRRAVQITGYFNTIADYSKHAELMDVASNLLVEVFGDRGKHSRATIGVASLPLNSPVEIQAIFDIG